MFKVIHADCIAEMRSMDDNSIDSICTDPPYELGFMGKDWDSSGIANSVELWAQALRVLKPGGHLLAFSGTRTYHRMVCAIEDAGFEVRDQIGWVYGSGFPKSLDVSKAIDKAAGTERAVIGRPTDGRYAYGFTEDVKKALSGVVAAESATGFSGDMGVITAPATESARQWQGWGTALKPAWEPIVVARKPLIGTVAANVQAHGTGALNIDGCRVESDTRPLISSPPKGGKFAGVFREGSESLGTTSLGRWPANIIHDGSDEVLAAFSQAQGAVSNSKRKGNGYGEGFGGMEQAPGYGDTGSAARFFYCAKASRTERNVGLQSGMKNTHPTVKPVAVCAYLQRLVTPPGGTTLDPFAGSGSFGVAAMREGFRYIGIDNDIVSVQLARVRIASEELRDDGLDDVLDDALDLDDGLNV